MQNLQHYIISIVVISNKNIDSFLEEEEAILQHFTFQIFLICGEVDRGDLKLERKRKWRVAVRTSNA